MCATPTVANRWKRLFLGLEAFVIFACLYGIALHVMWPYEVSAHPGIVIAFRILISVLMPMLWTSLAVICFLMVVSPFFLASLRASALKAWLIGVAGFIYLLGILFGWWLR